MIEKYKYVETKLMIIISISIHCLDVGGRAVWAGLMGPIKTIVETLHILSVYRTPVMMNIKILSTFYPSDTCILNLHVDCRGKSANS